MAQTASLLMIRRTSLENSQLLKVVFDDMIDPPTHARTYLLWHLNFISHILYGAGEVFLAQVGVVVLYTDYLFLKIYINALTPAMDFNFFSIAFAQDLQSILGILNFTFSMIFYLL